MLSVQGNAKVPWEDRLLPAFFRGRDSNKQRLELVKMAKLQPELIDARITQYFFFRESEGELGVEPRSSFFDFFKYKYQVV